ncbi:hypothetical protein R1flu_027401 [Riccia fluitans]|uniref:Uncharacterized protein n=1 Tax=Riccia fluitans TaxID=41844 RepID=A0ABD1XIP2_9MARC
MLTHASQLASLAFGNLTLTRFPILNKRQSLQRSIHHSAQHSQSARPLVLRCCCCCRCYDGRDGLWLQQRAFMGGDSELTGAAVEERHLQLRLSELVIAAHEYR